MIAVRVLEAIAWARLREAEHLLRAGEYDGGVYLCGYAVELGLKVRICETLKWRGYPGTRAEFRGYQSLQTHNLRVLLRLSGYEERVRTMLSEEWSEVIRWTPEVRYDAVGTVARDRLATMIQATRTLLRAL